MAEKMYNIKPFKDGDWAVFKSDFVDVTTKDMEGTKYLKSGEHLILVGSLEKCENYLKGVVNYSF